MSKIERLNARVAKLLTAAVHEVLEVVRETVSEYQEKTARTQRENESLRRRLRELQDKVKTVGTATSESVVSHGSGERARIKHHSYMEELSPGLKQVTRPTLSEEKKEVTEQSMNCGQRQNVDKGTQRKQNGLELDDLLESDCSLLQLKDTCLVSNSVVQVSDAAPRLFTPPCGKADHDLDPIHKLNVSDVETPSTSGLGISPSRVSTEIKTESEPSENVPSELCADQNPFYCTDPSNKIGLIEPIQDPQMNSQSCGLVYFHTDYNTFGDRFAFEKNITSNLDTVPHKQYHRNEEQHHCILCGKTFNGIGSLRIHQRCHTGEKPYCCMQCGRCFSHAGDFKKHKRVHTGEKPYCCTICGKCFSQSGYLKIHQRYHTGERPYCCNQCGKSFSHSSNLKKHQQIHIGQTL